MKSSILLLAAVVTGCSAPSSEPSGTASGAPGETPFKVALITPSPVNDAGWSALAYRGLQAIESKVGAEANNVVASNPQEIKDAMRSYAQKGYSLVIGHGYEYNQHGLEIAKDFPKTVFMSSSGDKTAANVGCFRFYLEQAMYVCGFVAAKMSKSGVVGMVGGPEVPSIASTFDGFEQGAKAGNANIKVLRAFTGSNDDVGKAKAQTLAMIDQKADFIIHQANAGAPGVFEACKERGVMAFGTNSDQAAASPETVLASAVIVAEDVFTSLARSVKDGSFQSGVLLVGMKEKAVSVVWNPALESKVPADLRTAADDAIAKILSGEIVVKKRDF
jgi:basic membrane lipoprotein Med (substrate-binding protein (PBP1-ABC) superfamily)